MQTQKRSGCLISTPLSAYGTALTGVPCLIFFTALFFLTSVTGAELVCYTLCWLFAAFLLLFCEDIFPLMGIAPLLYFSPSAVNNPGNNPQSVFFPENGLNYIIFLIVTFVALFFVRCYVNVKRGVVRPRLPGLTWGFVLLGVAFLSGGLGSGDVRSPGYGALVFASLALLYFMFTVFFDFSRVPKDYFAYILFCGGILISAQLFWLYATGVPIVNGVVQKAKIVLGWGISNNVGGCIAMMLPGAVYLAAVKRHGWLFLSADILFFLAIVLSLSRTAIAVGFIVLLVGCFFAAARARQANRVGLSIVFLGICAAFAYLLWRDPERTLSVLHDALRFQENGSGRVELYRKGVELFLKYPVFGAGFYAGDIFSWGAAATFIPGRWHNTIVQILASCGSVGMIAYAIHRLQTLTLLFRKPCFEKSVIALFVTALLLTSLFDCHLFNLGPGLWYSVMLSFAERGFEERALSRRTSVCSAKGRITVC